MRRTITDSSKSTSLGSVWLKKDLYFFVLAAALRDNILKHHTSSASSRVYAFTLLPFIEPLRFGVILRDRSNGVQGVMLIMCSVFLTVQRNLKIDSNCKKITYFESSVMWKCCQYWLKLY